MREEVVSQGIVLKVIPFKEHDAILSVYFKEYGKLSLYASGLRKPKSKNASSCQPMMLSEFRFFLKKDMCKLVSSQLIDGHRHLESSLPLQACANLLLEYYYRAIGNNQPNLDHYQFLIGCLKALNEGYHYLQVYLFILAFILKDSGSAIMVDHCAMCEDVHQIVSVDVVAGGFVCLKHLKEQQVTYTPEFLKMFRLINKGSIHQIDLLTSDLLLLKSLKNVMEQFYDEYSSIRLNSKQFI